MRNVGGKPRYALWENVFGAFSSSGGDDFQRVLEELCQVKDVNISVPKLDKWTPNGEIVGDNFSLAWRTFDAQYWGVAQRRRRIFLLVDFDGDTAGKIMFRNEGLGFHSKVKTWKEFARTTTENSGKSLAKKFTKIKKNKVKLEKNDINGKFCSLDLKQPNWSFNIPENYVIGERPFYKNTTKLSGELEINADKKYYLSPTACKGILRRALEKKKTLPTVLQLALENQIKNEIDDIRTNCSGVTIGATIRRGNNLYNEVSATLTTSIGDNLMSVIGKPETFKKSTHPRTSDEGQGWEETDVNDTLNVFDLGETRTPTLITQSLPIENHPNDSRIKISEEDISQTLSSRMGTGGGNTPMVLEEIVEGNGQRPSHRGNGYNETNVSYTLNTVGQHAVAYGISSKDSNGMKSDNPNSGYYEADTSRTLDLNGGNPACNQGGMAIVEYQDVIGTLAHDDYKGVNNQYVGENKCIVTDLTTYSVDMGAGKSQCNVVEELSPTLTTTHYGEPCINTNEQIKSNQENNYFVRRLTPVECERLQGMPDNWCYNLENNNPTQEDIDFWSNVFETHRITITKGKKSKTPNQIIKYLGNPLTDSAIYKIQGNGIALPNAWFVLEGISKLNEKE